jgi:hypothetical protein
VVQAAVFAASLGGEQSWLSPVPRGGQSRGGQFWAVSPGGEQSYESRVTLKTLPQACDLSEQAQSAPGTPIARISKAAVPHPRLKRCGGL